MKRAFPMLLFFLAMAGWLSRTLSLVQADTSSSSEMKNFKSYGNCKVWTEVDMLTDEKSHRLGCAEATSTDITLIMIGQYGRELAISPSKGMFHTDERIPIAIRVDKGPVIRRSAHSHSKRGGKGVSILDSNLALSLLNELTKGHRIVIQVGPKRGNIQLQGSAAAVGDFRQRLITAAPQTLEIPIPSQP